MTEPLGAVLDVSQPRLDGFGLAQLVENPGRAADLASSHVQKEQKKAHQFTCEAARDLVRPSNDSVLEHLSPFERTSPETSHVFAE
jgi:hypothetical protein